MELISLTTKNFQNTIEAAARTIQNGAVIIAPTDTVYGLIANAKNDTAVKRIYAIKARDLNKPLPIFVKHIAMAKSLATINAKNENFLELSWPGKITAILPLKPKVKIYGTDNKTVALRIPNYHFINSLIGILNIPITGTSANISGYPAATKIDEVLKQFQNAAVKPDIVINAGDLKKSNPSTIIDLTGKIRKIVRP